MNHKTTWLVMMGCGLVFAGSAMAQVPPIPVIMSPVGHTVTAGNPVLDWDPAIGATWYRVWLSSSSGPGGNLLKNNSGSKGYWLQGNSNTSLAINSASLKTGSSLPPGNYKWWVLAWNTNGVSGWGPGASFTVAYFAEGASGTIIRNAATTSGTIILLAQITNVPAGTYAVHFSSPVRNQSTSFAGINLVWAVTTNDAVPTFPNEGVANSYIPPASWDANYPFGQSGHKIVTLSDPGTIELKMTGYGSLSTGSISTTGSTTITALKL